jgi:hypothetical protein
MRAGFSAILDAHPFVKGVFPAFGQGYFLTILHYDLVHGFKTTRYFIQIDNVGIVYPHETGILITKLDIEFLQCFAG